jgi:transposase
VDEEIQVPLPERCPACGGLPESLQWADQYQTEVVRKTHVTHFRIEVGCCRGCGKRVQGRHRRQSSDALGAAASQLGPEALALASVLNKQLGLGYAKTAAVLEQGFGLKVTRGAVSHAMARLAVCCEPTYQSLLQVVRSSPSVSVDETGWRVGGRRWWLWVAASQEATVYGIFPGRGFAQAARLLGAGYDGILVHDGWSIYWRFPSAFHQSCSQHLIRRSSEMAEHQSARAAAFPLAVKGLLQEGLRLRDRFARQEISEHGLAVATGRLESRLDKWLRRRWRRAENRRLAKHLIRQYPYLFSYLHCPGLEATNWRAEQALRPAVVARKVWGGNRTEPGARTHEVLMSVLHTSKQHRRDSIPLLVGLLRSPTDISVITAPSLDLSSN